LSLSQALLEYLSIAKKGDRELPTQASREKPRRADPKLSLGLRRAPDRMVVTEGVPNNLTLQLTKRES
jgi:hypothetical protein